MDVYGLIGYPIGHSFSPRYFNAKFAKEKIDACYRLFPIRDINELNDVLTTPGLKGLNVTSPYKEAVANRVILTGDASLIRAVNVIKPCGGCLKGFNTDITGFEEAYAALLENTGDKALILGTGGAANAAAFALRKMGKETLFVSRTKREGCLTYTELTTDIIHACDIIVNATPLGMHGHSEGEYPDIPYEYITMRHVCIDLIYNPRITEFRHCCGLMGAETAGGFPMLKKQAEASWRIWNSD